MDLLSRISLIDWAVFAAIFSFFIISLIFKIIGQKSNSIADYMVAGRKLSLPMFTATLIATWYSGIFGVTQISFEHGIYNFVTQGVFWYLAAACFAFFVVEKARKTQALTFAEMFKKTYGPHTGRTTAILILFKTLPIPYAISLGLFIKLLTNLGLETSILLGSSVVAAYCLLGGAKLTIYTDLSQFFLMFTAMILVVLYSYNAFGGIEYLRANLPSSHFSIAGNHHISAVFVWLFVAFSTTLLSPVFYQRCFSAQSAKLAKTGILISIGFWFICDILTTLTGLYAKAHMPDSLPSEAFMSYSLSLLPEGLRGIFLAAIAIVLFSALDSYLFITSSTFFYDILGEKYRNDKSLRKWAVLASAFITSILAMFFNGSIERVWVLTESVFLSAVLVPAVCIYALKMPIKDSKLAVIMIASSLVTLAWEVFGNKDLIDSFYVGILTNALLILILNKFEKTLQPGNR